MPICREVQEEVMAARRLFTDHAWPIIDMTRRSIEEAAAAILQHYSQRRGGPKVLP